MNNPMFEEHIIPTVQDALTNPLDHEINLGELGWTLTNTSDPTNALCISACEADHIIKAMWAAKRARDAIALMND